VLTEHRRILNWSRYKGVKHAVDHMCRSLNFVAAGVG
jgi:hypothetical protein